ncbi:MAG: mechanosensitive ion channel family protein [Lutibacter sp.]|nr:mechanosensitive ion channel family protein [Lutibacter sp.]
MMKKLFLFFLLFSASLIAQNKVKVDLSNPNATISTHLYFLQSSSYDSEKAATTIYGYGSLEAQEIAIKLKTIMDAKGLKVDFSKVPANPMYSDTTMTKSGNQYLLFPNKMPEIYLEKIEDNWYYSKETSGKVLEIYDLMYPWYSEKLQEIIPEVGHRKLFNVELWQYFGLLILLIVSVGLFYILRKIVYLILNKSQNLIINISNEEIKSSLKKLTRPVVLLILMAFIKNTLPSLVLHIDVNNFLLLAINIMVVIFWIYVFMKLVLVIMSIYGKYAESTVSKLDDQLVPVLRNFLMGIVIFGGLLKLLTLFGVDPVTVIAGASIGGIAIALASQDTVKNFIGTIMIFVDKPFHIGDWIEAGTVIGTVETVGFRSTTVRAADTTIFQIPNSQLSEMVVNNKGLRSFRRYTTNLGIRYDTPPELIEAFVLGIRRIIELEPSTRTDAFNVEFVGFADSSLSILLNIYFVNLDWNNEQASKHALHMKILKLAHSLGVEFAFPSSTLMIEQFPHKKAAEPIYNTDENRIKEILDAINLPQEDEEN